MRRINLKLLINAASRVMIGFLLILGIFFSALHGAFANEAGAEAEEKERVVTFGAETDFNYRYIWRGFAWSNGPVWQPSVWVSAYDLTFSVWTNFVLNDELNQGQFNEFDFTLSYDLEWKKIGIEPEIAVWYYPNQADSPTTGETSLKISYPIYKTLAVFTSHAFDYARYRGSYFGEAGLSYTHDFSQKFSIETSANLGWGSKTFNDTYAGVPQWALEIFAMNLSGTYYPLSYLYLKPHVEMTTLLDGDLRNSADDPTLINGGLAVGIEF